jgi:hypothetical protein
LFFLFVVIFDLRSDSTKRRYVKKKLPIDTLI